MKETTVGDDRSEADRLDREGAEPAAESGAGYGSHAEEADEAQQREGSPE